MAKAKFKFNPESLQYDRIERSIKERLLRFLAYFMGSIVLAGIYMLVFSQFFDSPKERSLKRENNQLLAQYEIMTKKLNQIGVVLADLEERDDNLYRTIFTRLNKIYLSSFFLPERSLLTNERFSGLFECE